MDGLTRILVLCGAACTLLLAGCRTGVRSPASSPSPSPPVVSSTPPPEHAHPTPAAWPRSDTIAGRLRTVGPTARGCWRPDFRRVGLRYPPGQVTLVALKQERVLEVWAGGAGRMRLVRRIPILAASGGPGPKRREGDLQVPEGVYRLDLLNPNSAYHLSMRVNYPNAFDRRMAARDGRRNLGGAIMIHGGAASVGCIAVGDAAAEDLFVLAADTGLPHMRVIICPHDLRNPPPGAHLPTSPVWVGELYRQTREALAGME